MAFLFWLYSDGLKVWFISDDFAWLGLIREVHEGRTCSMRYSRRRHRAPSARGASAGSFCCSRACSDWTACRFGSVFSSRWRRIVTLVAWITRRITGSPAEAPIKGACQAAGFLAAILWTANTSLATVMAWTSAYNEALCPLFLLTALACFIRYVETGRRVFWWWQVVVFTLGFGALEVNVVYPALAAAWVLFVAEPEKRRKAPRSASFRSSVFPSSTFWYTAQWPLCRTTEPTGSTSTAASSSTLALYWKWSLLPLDMERGRPFRAHGTGDLLDPDRRSCGFCHSGTGRKFRYAVLFCVFWFLITLAPMLPLPDHHTDYYLTVPVIGLAMLCGLGISRAFGAVSVWRLAESNRLDIGRALRAGAVLILLAAYLRVMIPTARSATRWWLDRSLASRGGWFSGCGRPRKPIREKPSFWTAFRPIFTTVRSANRPSIRLGLNEAYLTPASRDTIHPHLDFGKLSHLILDPAALRRAITHEQVVIYSDVGDHLRNVTEAWERSVSSRSPPTDHGTSSSRRWQSPVGLSAGSRMVTSWNQPVFAGCRGALRFGSAGQSP